MAARLPCPQPSSPSKKGGGPRADLQLGAAGLARPRAAAGEAADFLSEADRFQRLLLTPTKQPSSAWARSAAGPPLPAALQDLQAGMQQLRRQQQEREELPGTGQLQQPAAQAGPQVHASPMPAAGLQLPQQAAAAEPVGASPGRSSWTQRGQALSAGAPPAQHQAANAAATAAPTASSPSRQPQRPMPSASPMAILDIARARLGTAAASALPAPFGRLQTAGPQLVSAVQAGYRSCQDADASGARRQPPWQVPAAPFLLGPLVSLVGLRGLGLLRLKPPCLQCDCDRLCS
jgi:hypothetical protein